MKFKFQLKRVAQAVAVVAALSAPAAQAASSVVIDWGVHGLAEAYGYLVPGGAFDDFFKFTMPGSGGVSSVAVSNNLIPVIDITGGTVRLWEGTYGDPFPDTLKLTYSFDGTTGSTPHNVGGLLSGASYYYEVSGTAAGFYGGIYTLTSTLIPEPGAYAMILAGLGLMGFVVRRRKQS